MGEILDFGAFRPFFTCYDVSFREGNESLMTLELSHSTQQGQ